MRNNAATSNTGKFGNVINSPEFKNIVQACEESPLFSHRHADALIELLRAHSLDDPFLLSLTAIAAEMGVPETNLIHPDLEGRDCHVVDVAEEEQAIYGDAHAICEATPKAIADRKGTTHRRPKVSVFNISGAGLHIGFYKNLPLAVRKIGERIEAPYEILPNNHQMINLIGGLPGESLESSTKVVKNAVYIGDSFAFTNYAHWTLDWFPRLKWILEEHGDAADLSLVFNRRPSSFHFEMLESIGFNRDNIIYPDAPTSTYFIKAENILATNIGRDFRHSCHAGASWALDFLRDKLVAEDKSPFSPGIRMVVMRPSRGIVFSESALSSLRDKGFIFVRLERLEFATQVALFANASVILAPHGAGLSSLAFCSPGTHVLEVFNGLYGTHAFYTVAHFGGLDYSCTVGTLDDSHSGRPIDLDCHIDEQTLSKWFSKIGI